MAINIYRKSFYAKCPENGQTILYRLALETTGSVVMVEAIDAAIAEAIKLAKPYHENIADYLISELGGVQTICAVHHGTNIETRRP